MQLKTIKNLSNNVYSVRLETLFSTAEDELITDFGDSTISVGGDFYGNTFTCTQTLPLLVTITQGAAKGEFVSGLLHRYTAADFTVGALDALGTITAIGNIDYTLSSGSKHISSEFPYVKSFSDENRANLFAAEMKTRAGIVMDNLRSNIDDFSSEVVVSV